MQEHSVETEVQLQCIRNLAAGRDGVSAPLLDIFTRSPEKESVPNVQESGWVSGQVWTDAEYFTFT